MGHETIIGVQKLAGEKNVSHAFSTAIAYPELWIRVLFLITFGFWFFKRFGNQRTS
jgi:flagellar biogenesis protein FliO